jgi:LmbE family N-acetylglucosaminyl deacetylase
VEEMHVAADYGGYDTHLLDYEDCKIIDDFAMRKHLAEIIRFYEPSLLFAPYHTNHGDHHDGKAHPDHCVTGEVVRKAARYAKFEGLDDLDGDAWDADHVVYYMVPSGVEPSFVVDVTPYMDAWHDLISCFSTQLNLKDGKVRAYLERVRENEGWRVGVDYAEVFRTATPVCIDFNDLE